MIEMRIVEIGDGCRPEFQYRYKNQLPLGCIADQFWKEWSEWKVAPYVSLMEIENFYIEQEKEQIKQNLKLSLKNYD